MNELKKNKVLFPQIPPVHKILKYPVVQELINEYGRFKVIETIRESQNELRDLLGNSTKAVDTDFLKGFVSRSVQEKISTDSKNYIRPVINLSGVVLHTNLGRALLPDVAIKAIQNVAGYNTNFEFDLATGERGDREALVEKNALQTNGSRGSNFGE